MGWVYQSGRVFRRNTFIKVNHKHVISVIHDIKKDLAYNVNQKENYQRTKHLLWMMAINYFR